MFQLQGMLSMSFGASKDHLATNTNEWKNERKFPLNCGLRIP